MTLTCVLLPIVAIKSHSDKVAVHKDNPLALLFHRVADVDILPGSVNETALADLDNLADEMRVKLDRDTPFTFVRSMTNEKGYTA